MLVACPKKCSANIVRCLLLDHYLRECEVAMRESSNAQLLAQDALRAEIHQLQGRNKQLQNEIKKSEAEKAQQRNAYHQNVEICKRREAALLQKLRLAENQQMETGAGKP